jgi:hypothetical protein
MSTIHHFGDSYGLCAKSKTEPLKHFVEISADVIGYQYNKQTRAGMSNEMIFDKILKNVNSFNNSDILFINFSYFARGCYWDKKLNTVISTNDLFGELTLMKSYPRQLINTKIEELEPLIEYYLNMTEDYNRKLFTLINSLFENLQKNGVRIFYIFVDKSNKWCDKLLNVGNNLKFENGFSEWLYKNSFHKEEETHYTSGIQIMLSDYMLSNTENFKLKIDNPIVNMDDSKLNTDLIIKNKPLL